MSIFWGVLGGHSRLSGLRDVSKLKMLRGVEGPVEPRLRAFRSCSFLGFRALRIFKLYQDFRG